jgi:hypothetical protein
MRRNIRVTNKTKLIIYGIKEKYPQLSPEFISELVNVKLKIIVEMFNEGELILPSKMNNL